MTSDQVMTMMAVAAAVGTVISSITVVRGRAKRSAVTELETRIQLEMATLRTITSETRSQLKSLREELENCERRCSKIAADSKRDMEKITLQNVELMTELIAMKRERQG